MITIAGLLSTKQLTDRNFDKHNWLTKKTVVKLIEVDLELAGF